MSTLGDWASSGVNGRQVIFYHSLYNAVDKWTDEELNWDDAIAFGYLAGSSIAMVYPDPMANTIGFFNKKLGGLATPVLIAATGKELIDADARSQGFENYSEYHYETYTKHSIKDLHNFTRYLLNEFNVSREESQPTGPPVIEPISGRGGSLQF